MKKLLADSSKCSGCGACERTCSNAFYKIEDKEKSAIRVTADDNSGYSIAVCDQCGDCMWMCSVMALSKADNGVVRLDKKSCVGCLICVGECLRNYFFVDHELPVPIKCSACGLCVKSCPGNALQLTDTQ